MKKWLYISLSVLMAVIIGVFAFSARVGATVYYNVEGIPKAYFYEDDVRTFLIQTTGITDEPINVNYKISYDSGDEITGTTLYCFYQWIGGDLDWVKITTDSNGNNAIQYWEQTGDSMGRLFYNGNNLTTGAGYMQDSTLFLSIDDEQARQSNLFYFYFFPGIEYQKGYSAGESAGYTDGIDEGIDRVQANPHAYNLYTASDLEQRETLGFNEGIDEGIDRVQANPNQYGLYSQEDYDRAYRDGMNAVNIPSFITGLLNGIAGFLNIKLGTVSIGAILLIPFTISMVWFVIRQFRGGGGS